MQQLCKRSLFCYYSIFEHHNLTCTGTVRIRWAMMRTVYFFIQPGYSRPFFY